MELYSLDKLGKKRFWREFFRRGMSLLLAIIMVLPAGGGVFAAEITHDEWYKSELVKALKTLPSSDKLEYEVIIPYTRNDSRWFAETKARQLFDEVTKELPIKQGILNMDGEATTILPVWEGTGDNRVLKSIKHTIRYHNSKPMLDKYKTDLTPYVAEIVKNKTDLKRVADAVKIVKSWENTNGNKLTMILFSILMEELGYKHVLDENFNLSTKPIINVEIVKGILKPVNIVAGTINEVDVSIITDDINQQIQYEINSLMNSIGVSNDKVAALSMLINGITGSITVTKFNEIVTKGAEVEIEIDRYDDAYNTLEAEGVTGDSLTGLETSLNNLKTSLNNIKLTLAEKAVTQAESSKISSDIGMAKDIVNTIDEEVMKSDGSQLSDNKNKIIDFNDRIEYVEQINAAVAAVEKAKQSKKAEDYGIAEALVNGLKEDSDVRVELQVKERLKTDLAALKTIIDADTNKKAVAEASKLVTLAEGNLTKYLNGTIDKVEMEKSKSDADGKVNTLAEGDDKTSLTNRMKAVEIRLTELNDVMPIVKSAVDMIERRLIEGKVTVSSVEVDVTKDNVITPDGFGATTYKAAVDAGKKSNAIGKALNARIVEINKVLDAIESVKGLNRNTLKTAKTAVGKINVKFSKVKNILNEIITDLEGNIADEQPEDLLNKTFTEVTLYNMTSAEITALIKTAKALIGKESDNIKKIKMTAVINAIDTAQKAKEAVALAEATKLRKDFDKADGLVKSISDNNLEYITSNPSNFSILKVSLSATLIDILKGINLAEATAAVVKAENTLNEKDYELAFTAIGKVEGDITDSGTDKGKLKQRLDVVKSVIDAAKALSRAVTAVNEAAKTSKELDNSKKIKSAKDALTEASMAIDSSITLDTIFKYKINTDTMSATIKDMNEVYIVAIEALKLLCDVQQKLDTSKTYEEALNDAKTAVGKVTDSKVRLDLESGIKAIEGREETAGSINKAEEKLIDAEKKLNGLLLGDNMDSDSYKPIKDLNNFATEIETVKKAIADADAEIKTIKDKRATEFKDRLTAVTAAKDVAILIAKAEGSNPLVKAEVDAASKALPKVKEDIINDDDGIIINHKAIKAYFEARVKYLNAELVKVQQFTEAKKLTDKAYETLSEGDIKKAIEYVAKIQDNDNKSKFNKGVTESPRIYGIDSIIDKFASEKVEKNITDAISGLQMDLKSGSKPVSDAKKSTDVFTNLVKLADSRLGENSLEPPTDLIKYADNYADKIADYNTNNTALAKAQQVWQQIAKADKSKSISDIDRLYIEFELLIDIVEGIGAKFKDKYYKEYNEGGVYTGGLLGTLYGEITRIKSFQTGEDDKKAKADEAILAVIATLRAYTEATSAEEKKTAREQLPTDIGEVRKAVAKIDSSDKAAHKEYNAKITLMELYRDAINKINRAQISCTPANVKDAKAAVDKCDKAKDNGDYIFVNVVLVREIDELYERLVNEESAEKAKILVDKAWETKSQIDFDIAKNAVTRLPENNEAQIKIKNDLLKSLDDLKEIIDKLEETDRNAVAEAEKALKEALKLIYESKIQNIDPDEDEINEAYAKLTGRGIDGTSNEDPEFAEYYIKTAKDYANSIVRDIDGKNALLEIIAEREHLLKVYSEEILIKEARRLIVKADASVIKRNSMPKDTEEERKAWEAQTVIANGDLDSAAIAIKRINLPENFDARQRLLERLGIITRDLNTGTTTDKIAYINGLLREATKRVADARDVFEKGDVDGKLIGLLTDAKNLVGDIEIEIEMLVVNNESEQSAKDKLKELVAALRQNVTNIENGISDKDLIANAEKAIKAAEDRVKKKEYESAKIDVMEAEMNTEQISDTNAIKRNELRSKINKLKNEIAQATGGEETPPLDDQNDPKIVAKALQLYYKAKASLLQKDIDAARKYINENMVHNTTLKQWLLAKLAELEKIRVGINKPGDIEDEKRKEEEKKRKEEEAKRKAEEARKKKYPGIDEAINADERDTGNSDPKWGDTKGLKKK